MGSQARGRTLALACLLAGSAGLAAAGGPAGDEVCLQCHSGGATGQPALDVDSKALKGSVHGRAGLSCTDCHASLAGVSDFPHGAVRPVACGSCHDGAEKAMAASVHRPDESHSPRCSSCHGSHDVARVQEKGSRVAPLEQPPTCLKCHADPKLAKEHGLPVREGAQAYERGIHYQQLLGGNAGAPTCSTCHGAHEILSHASARSPIARANVAGTCGMCHSEIAEKFGAGVHGSALAKGNADVPTCTGCHKEHTIRGPQDPDSPVYASRVAVTCSACHADERLSKAYGLPASQFRTYLGSYHGAASRFGETTVANCASCHRAHDILPSSDPRSSVNAANLVKTCGACHPQAGRNFASGKIHVADDPKDNYWAWAVKRMYLAMIWGIIGTFLAFILVDLWWRARGSLLARRRS